MYHGYHSFSQKTSNTTASYYYFNSKLKFFFNVWEANSVETITSMINAMCVLQWPIRGSPPPKAKGGGECVYKILPYSTLLWMKAVLSQTPLAKPNPFVWGGYFLCANWKVKCISAIRFSILLHPVFVVQT